MANKWKPYDIGDYDGFAGSLAEALGGYWSDSAAEGNSPTGMDITNMAFQEYMQNQQNQFTQNMYAEDRAWQEEMYERYQTIPAQVRQMQEAGLNPALMYGQGAGSPSAVSSGQMPSSGSGAAPSSSGRSPIQGFQKAMSAIQAVLGMLSSGSSVAQGISSLVRNSHMNKKDDAQAALFAEQQNTEKDKQYQLASQALLDRSKARLNEIDATYRDSINKWTVESIRQQYIKSYQDTQKILSDIDVNNSVIKINGKQLEILDKNLSIQEQELQLKSLQVLMKNREALMQPDMLELQKQYLEAQVLVEEARTETEKAYAEEARANAANAVWDAMTKKKLIDVKYYEQQVRNMKVQNGVAVTHAIVDSACKISSEALGWATLGISKIGSKTESSIIQPAYGGPQPTFKGLYQ